MNTAERRATAPQDPSAGPAAADAAGCGPTSSADRSARRWCTLLSAVSLLNIGLWSVVAWRTDWSNRYLLAQLALSGVFVVACAFRSFLPRVDLERQCLW